MGGRRCAGTPDARGLVVEGTGNGTVHAALLAALVRAQAAGVGTARHALRRRRRGWRAGGCAASAGELSPAKARIELLLGSLTSAA
jgi:L-asparaginase